MSSSASIERTKFSRHCSTARIRRGTFPLAISIVCTMYSPPSFAVDIATLDQFRENESFKVYLEGVGNGWMWANAKLASKKQPLLFCVPATLKLTTDNYLGLIDANLKAARARGGLNEQAPIELVLLTALEEAFPCKK